MFTKKSVATTLAAGVVGAAAMAVVGTPAEAIPAPQETCVFTTTSFSTASGWVALDTPVSINNGTVARTTVGQLSADLGVDTGAEIRLGYSIDGGPVRERVYGPANLANHQEYWETRASLAVFPLPSGTHTVTPYVRVNGPAGKTGQRGAACFTVEARTR